MRGRERMAVVVRRAELGDDDELAYWSSRPVTERIEAVEVYRRRLFEGLDRDGSERSRVRRVIHRA